MVFIPGAFKPLKSASLFLHRNVAFLKAEVVVPSSQAPPPVCGVLVSSNAPPLPPGTCRHHSPVLMSNTHNQTGPDAGIWVSASCREPSLEAWNCRVGRVLALLGSYSLDADV